MCSVQTIKNISVIYFGVKLVTGLLFGASMIIALICAGLVHTYV